MKIFILSAALLCSLTLSANTVKIVQAKAKETKEGWTVDVTLKHDDVDQKHYADQWRILSKAGKVLGVRELGHPHKDQPFTRNLKGVTFPDGIKTVYIEAHCKVHGWAKKKYALKLK